MHMFQYNTNKMYDIILRDSINQTLTLSEFMFQYISNKFTIEQLIIYKYNIYSHIKYFKHLFILIKVKENYLINALL
jgi:hypothetical protein